MTRASGGNESGTLSLPSQFEGWPGIAHGGGVLACLYELARPFLVAEIPVTGSVRLHRRVDLGCSITWRAGIVAGGARLELHQEGRLLAEGIVTTLLTPPPDSLASGPERTGPSTVPGSAGCLACGLENPIGLQLRLHYDEQAVWKLYRPRPLYRRTDGSVSPYLHFIVLDEIGWWLGLLAAGEAGLTNEVLVRVFRPVPAEAPLLIRGTRASVTPEDDRGRVWRVEATVSADGEPVAWGSARFVAMRGLTSRLIPGLLAASRREDVHRLFPQYVAPRGADPRGGA